MIERNTTTDRNCLYPCQLRQIDQAERKFITERFPKSAIRNLRHRLPIAQLQLPPARERLQAPHLTTQAYQRIAIQQLVPYLDGERQRRRLFVQLYCCTGARRDRQVSAPIEITHASEFLLGQQAANGIVCKSYRT